MSVLASLGVPRDKRDYVGRWHIVTASDEYVRTARHVVLSLQEEALRGVCLDERWDLLNSYENVVVAQSQSQTLQLRSCLRFCLGPHYVRPNSASAADAPEVGARAPMPAILQAQAEDLPPFYIAIVGKGRLRRLHRKGGCGTAARDLREMLPVFELQDAVYDSACKHCWRNGENPGEDAGDGAVSSESDGCDSSSCGSSIVVKTERAFRNDLLIARYVGCTLVLATAASLTAVAVRSALSQLSKCVRRVTAVEFLFRRVLCYASAFRAAYCHQAQ